MTVVVDDQFVSQFLGFDHKSGWPEGAETNDGADFTIRRDQHGSKIAVIPGKRIQGARPASVTAANDTPCRYPSCVQELPAIHDILRTKRENYGIAGHYTLITAEESLPGEFDGSPASDPSLGRCVLIDDLHAIDQLSNRLTAVRYPREPRSVCCKGDPGRVELNWSQV